MLEGRAHTARGAAHFLTVGRVRHAGARGQLTMRADSGFYTQPSPRMDVRFSITIRQHKSLPEDAWTPIPYWMDGAADPTQMGGVEVLTVRADSPSRNRETASVARGFNDRWTARIGWASGP